MYIEEAEIKMKKAIENMEARFTNVRAGRANPAMLNGIKVMYYGASAPLNTVANITVPEARQLSGGVQQAQRTAVADSVIRLSLQDIRQSGEAKILVRAHREVS